MAEDPRSLYLLETYKTSNCLLKLMHPRVSLRREA
jgi:hypothetical protein